MAVFFFYMHKTAYDLRISYWSSVVCSSDLPPMDEDYIEPDMDSAYSYLDELASEHAAEPATEPEPEPAAMPATGLALQWLELFPKMPINGMTGSIADNCTVIFVEGKHWILHRDTGQTTTFHATTQPTKV